MEQGIPGKTGWRTIAEGPPPGKGAPDKGSAPRQDRRGGGSGLLTLPNRLVQQHPGGHRHIQAFDRP